MQVKGNVFQRFLRYGDRQMDKLKKCRKCLHSIFFVSI